MMKPASESYLKRQREVVLELKNHDEFLMLINSLYPSRSMEIFSLVVRI